MWFGYARVDLLAAQEHGVVAAALHRYAADRGFGDGTVIFEPFTAAVILRDMVAELDRADPAAAMAPRLRGLAQTWGIDLDAVFDDTGGTEVLWQLIEQLEHSSAAHLIVPSRAHLTELSAPGRAAASRLAESPTITVHFLDSSSTDELPARLRDELQVLVETPIGAIPAVAQLDVATELIRFGQNSAVEPVDAVYVALINEVQTPVRGAGFLAAGPDPAVIRLLATATGHFVVELEEPYPHTSPVSRSLTELCTHTERFVDRGRTWTRCLVRLPDANLPGGRA